MYPKLLNLTLLSVLLSVSLSAQITSGTIEYLETRTFPLWEGMSNEMKERVEEARARGDFDRIGELKFNEIAFSYSQQERDRRPPPNGGRGGGWMSRATDNPDVFYTNLQDSNIVEQRRILDRSFIIEDSWQIPEWEVPDNQRPNMAYTLPSEVAYAVSQDGDTLTAYFTRSIPLAIGPRGYGGLPGAIVYLKVDRDEFSTEYTLQGIKPATEEIDLVIPEDGDAVTRERFNELKARREEARERQRRGWRQRRRN
ncbi:MAG: GLPGLI family protein [Bacteroidota bacterium]